MAEGDHSFTPSHASLVDRYLRARIDVGNISDLADASLFHDADVCSARPHDLVRDRTPARVPRRDAGDGQQWFFFSPARFVGKRRSRTVDGTNGKESWHSEACPKAVEGIDGGFVQMFSYHIRTAPGSVEKPGWIMAEYTFKDSTRAGDVVLCKVYKSPRGPWRSKAASSSSCTSSGKPGAKRKAADDAEHLEAATPSTRPRLSDEDDVVLFAEDVERDLMSHHDHHDDTAPQFGETTTQHMQEIHPEPQLAVPEASVDGFMTLQELEAFMMTDEEDDGTMLQVPEGEDPVAFYLRCMGLYGADEQQQDTAIQQQDADIQTVSEYDAITTLATGVTVDELLLDGPSMSCLHPAGGNLGVLCS